LTHEELKGIIYVIKKDFRKLPTRTLDEKQGTLIAEKDKDVLQKKDRFTKRILKDFVRS
jgi:hypothetical protein